MLFLTCSWRFFISFKVLTIRTQVGKNIGIEKPAGKVRKSLELHSVCFFWTIFVYWQIKNNCKCNCNWSIYKRSTEILFAMMKWKELFTSEKKCIAFIFCISKLKSLKRPLLITAMLEPRTFCSLLKALHTKGQKVSKEMVFYY